MKISVAAFAISLGSLGSAMSVWATAPPVLTMLRAVHTLSNAQASQNLRVAFEATVTYYRGFENTLFVQDGDAAIYVSSPSGAGLVPGDRVLVRGKTQGSLQD